MKMTLTFELGSSLFLQNPVPMFFCAPDTLKILGANDAACSLYGYPQSELLCMNIWKLSTDNGAGKRVVTDKSFRSVTTHTTSSGQSIQVELRGAPYSCADAETVLVSVTDLASEGGPNPELARCANILRSLVDECPFGIYRMNLSTSRIEQANPVLLKTIGWTLEELSSVSIPGLYENPSDRDRFLAQLSQTGHIRDFETNFRAKNGRTIHVSLSGYLCSDPATGERYIQGYILDITRRRELEEELSHAHRMETVGRLAGGVAHDFNNITQAISLSCELALEGSLSPQLESKLLDVMGQTARAAEITRHLLAFSRRQVMQPRVVDLNDCVRRALALISRTVGMNVRVELKLDESADHVFVDPEQLTLAMIHLADNAREAMPNGGALQISTASKPGNSDASRGPLCEPCTVLTVSDNGTGMDEETMKHIFEPFFSTKERTASTGLGLSTVHGIIAQSKGRIECSSKPGNGATFHVYLPVTHAELPVPAKHRSRHSATGVLLVEDDPIVNKHLAQALRQAGFTVQCARNGVEALAVFDPAQHQLVITDIIMPKLDGVGLTRKLCELFPALPIVLISGFNEETSGLRNLPQGHLCYLQKPFPAARLIAAINDLLDQSAAESKETDARVS